jgi:hypothetical protein
MSAVKARREIDTIEHDRRECQPVANAARMVANIR